MAEGNLDKAEPTTQGGRGGGLHQRSKRTPSVLLPFCWGKRTAGKGCVQLQGYLLSLLEFPRHQHGENRRLFELLTHARKILSLHMH